MHGARDGVGDLAIGTGEVGQGAVRFDMRDTQTLGAGTSVERADLVDQHRLEFGQRDVHAPPAEPLQVGIARMRADADTVFERQGGGRGHHQRIAGMVAARDVGRADDAEHLGIAAHAPGAETFAEVGVEVEEAVHADFSVVRVAMVLPASLSSSSVQTDDKSL